MCYARRRRLSQMPETQFRTAFLGQQTRCHEQAPSFPVVVSVSTAAGAWGSAWTNGTLRGPPLLMVLLIAPRFGVRVSFLPKALICVLLGLSARSRLHYEGCLLYENACAGVLHLCMISQRENTIKTFSHLALVVQRDGTGVHVGGAQGGERKHGPQGYRLRLGVPRYAAGSTFLVAKRVGVEVG